MCGRLFPPPPSFCLGMSFAQQTNQRRRGGREGEGRKNSPARGAAEARLTRGSAGQRGAAASQSEGCFVCAARHSWFQAWGFACFSLALTGCLNLVNKQFENDWGKIIFSLKPRFPNCPINRGERDLSLKDLASGSWHQSDCWSLSKGRESDARGLALPWGREGRVYARGVLGGSSSRPQFSWGKGKATTEVSAGNS